MSPWYLYIPLEGKSKGESIREARSCASPQVPSGSPVPFVDMVSGRGALAAHADPLEHTNSPSRRPDPADSHVLDAGVHPAGRPGDAALLLWDPDCCLALPGLR